MKSNFIGPFLLWLKGRGSPVETWLTERGVDLTTIGAIECHVPHALYCDLLSLAETSSQETALGLAFAQSTVRVYAFMEALWQNCPSVGAVLDTWGFYDKVMAGRMTFAITHAEGMVAIHQRCASYDLALERVSNEFLIGWFFVQLRTLSGVPLAPVEVGFAHPAPRDIGPYVDFFGTSNLVFDATENRIVFDARVRALPIGLADARVFEALSASASERTPSEAPPRALLERLHEAIEQQLPHGAPQLEDIAKRLAVSVRTLQRRIAEEQSTFIREVERVRELTARQLVRNESMTFGEVAARLGYADTSTFNRAFRRWTGRTPSEFRARPDAASTTD